MASLFDRLRALRQHGRPTRVLVGASRVPRVAIDARWFFHGPPSGQVVTVEMVTRLSELSRHVRLTVILSGSRVEASSLQVVLPAAKIVRVPDLTSLGTSVLIFPWLLKFLKSDLVLTHNFCPPFGARERWILLHDAIFLRKKQWFTVKERLYLRWIKPLARRATFVYTVSRSEQSHLLKAGVGAPDRIGVLHLAPRDEFRDVPLDRICAARRVHGLPPQYLLCLGRVNVRKRVTEVVRAAGLSKSVTPACPLVIAGPEDGVQDRRLSEESDLLGPRLRRLGYVNSEHLPGLIAGATALISLSETEGFGLPPLEAAAAGTPVVVTDSAVAREVLGDAALFVPDPDDVEAVARAIDSVLGDLSQRDEFAERGRALAERYSWDATAAQLVEHILRAVT